MSSSVLQPQTKAVSRAGPLSRACHRSPRNDSDLEILFVQLRLSALNEVLDDCSIARLVACTGKLSAD